jgi:tetratricopeptide (TPR) repeat protein
MRIKIRNDVDKLTDNVRFNTDLKAKANFRKAMNFLSKQFYLRKNTFRKSALSFMKIAKKTRDPLDKAYALGWAGRCYEDSGDMAIAAVCYMAAVELAPSDVFALERLGDYFFEAKNEPEESVKRYNQILEYDPTAPRTYYKLGKLYSERGESEKAIDRYRKSIEVNNGYIAAMAEAAIESAKKGDKKGALSFYLLAMANDLYEFEKLGGSIEKCL